MMKHIKEWWRVQQAKRALNDQFERGTGHPIYGADTEEAKAFLESGLTPHEWLVGGGGEWRYGKFKKELFGGER